MPTVLTRMTFAVTEEIEATLGRFKKEMFYDRNNSEMIRELIMAGIRANEQTNLLKGKGCDRASQYDSSTTKLK